MKHEPYVYNPPLKVDCSKCGHELFVCEKVVYVSFLCPKCGQTGSIVAFVNNVSTNDFISDEKPAT